MKFEIKDYVYKYSNRIAGKEVRGLKRQRIIAVVNKAKVPIGSFHLGRRYVVINVLGMTFDMPVSLGGIRGKDADVGIFLVVDMRKDKPYMVIKGTFYKKGGKKVWLVFE